MLKISFRDSDVFKPQLDFQATPTQSDFYISANDSNSSFSWSTDGKTIGNNLNSITLAAEEIKLYAEKENHPGKIWFLDGYKRKFLGDIART